jgi:hypothetical protein
MASVYGEKRAQGLADEEWLRDAGAKGWVVLTERDALAAAGVRPFCLTTAQLRGSDQTARL